MDLPPSAKESLLNLLVVAKDDDFCKSPKLGEWRPHNFTSVITVKGLQPDREDTPPGRKREKVRITAAEKRFRRAWKRRYCRAPLTARNSTTVPVLEEVAKTNPDTVRAHNKESTVRWDAARQDGKDLLEKLKLPPLVQTEEKKVSEVPMQLTAAVPDEPLSDEKADDTYNVFKLPSLQPRKPAVAQRMGSEKKLFVKTRDVELQELACLNEKRRRAFIHAMHLGGTSPIQNQVNVDDESEEDPMAESIKKSMQSYELGRHLVEHANQMIGYSMNVLEISRIRRRDRVSDRSVLEEAYQQRKLKIDNIDYEGADIQASMHEAQRLRLYAFSRLQEGDSPTSKRDASPS